MDISNPLCPLNPLNPLSPIWIVNDSNTTNQTAQSTNTSPPINSNIVFSVIGFIIVMYFAFEWVLAKPNKKI